jgi:hypothetical protein
MFNTPDECIEALLRNTEMRRCDAVSIFRRPSTDTYRYSPDQRRESGEELYAVLQKFVNNDNARLLRERSSAAREYFDNHPMPGTTIFGSRA